MSYVARDQRVCATGKRHFEKRQIVRIRKLDCQWVWHDALSHRLQRREDSAQLSRIERELRPARHLAVLGENSIVGQERELAGEGQIEENCRGAVRREQR